MNQRLKQLRQLNGLSQKQVADLLGISQSAYSQIEKGTVSLSIDHLKTLTDKYGVSMDWLASGRGAREWPKHDTSPVPLVRVEDIKSYLKHLNGAEYLSGLDNYQLPGYAGTEFRMFEVPGQGIPAYILPTDILICSRVRHRKAVQEGDFIIEVTQDKIRLKLYNEAGEDLQDEGQIESWKVEAKLTSVMNSPNKDQERRISKLEQEFSEVRNQLSKLIQGGSVMC